MNDIVRETIHTLYPKTFSINGLSAFLREVEAENERLGWEAVIEDGDEDTSFKAAWYKERQLTDEEQAKRERFWKEHPFLQVKPLLRNTGETITFKRLKPLD